MIKYKGIHHLSMATGDLQATIHFWRDLLEMRLVVGMGKPGYRHYFFEISPNNLISFFEWPDVEPTAEKDHGFPVKGPFTFDHVAFEVQRKEDLWMLKDKLETGGFWVSEAIDHGFIHSIYSFDPNGIPVEFSYSVDGFNVRENPTLVDSSPHEAALEGPDPQRDRWPSVQPYAEPAERDLFPGEGRELFQENKKNWWKR